jgi:hypothetical protein
VFGPELASVPTRHTELHVSRFIFHYLFPSNEKLITEFMLPLYSFAFYKNVFGKSCIFLFKICYRTNYRNFWKTGKGETKLRIITKSLKTMEGKSFFNSNETHRALRQNVQYSCSLFRRFRFYIPVSEARYPERCFVVSLDPLRKCWIIPQTCVTAASFNLFPIS